MTHTNRTVRGRKSQKRGTANKARMFSVMRVLEAITATDAPTHIDHLLEQVEQCPEAFQAGELIEKMFESTKPAFGETSAENRLLPPPGVVLPLI